MELLETPGFRAEAAPRFDALRRELHWSQVSEPLQAFCAHPFRAADNSLAGVPAPTVPLWVRSWRVLRERGVRELVREAHSYLAWRLRSG